MSTVLKKLQKKWGSKENELQKENHDPLSLEHPENKGFANIICAPHQNGKQLSTPKQNTKTKDEWDSNRHLHTQHSRNTFTLNISNTSLIDQEFDELELTKRKKTQSTQPTSQKTYDIWLTISNNRKKIIHINLYATGNISIVPQHTATIYVRQDSMNKHLDITDPKKKDEIRQFLYNTDGDDILISIHCGDTNCDQFFKFIQYLHQNTPGDRDISKNYKSSTKHKRHSKLNKSGYTPTISSFHTPVRTKNDQHPRHSSGMGSKRSRAQLMATMGNRRNNPMAADRAEQRMKKLKKTPVADTLDRRKLQIDSFKTKKQSKSASYHKPGKDAGGFISRKWQGRRIHMNRGSKHTSDRTQAAPPCVSAYGAGGSGTGNTLSTRYREKRNGEQIGFKNLGNTCYINAILRSINSLSCLSSDLRRKYIFDLCGNLLSGTDSIYRSYLELLFKDMNNSKKEVLDPWIFKKIIGKMDEMFASYSQQDAHELLSFLLNALHDQIYKAIETHNAQNIKAVLSSEELQWLSPIHSNFHFKIEFEYQCTKCGYKRNKVESFKEMSLDLPFVKEAEKKEEKMEKEEKEEKGEKSGKSEKEEMDEDEKEDEKEAELSPLEKAKAELIRSSDGGCPLHKMQEIQFKKRGDYVTMSCVRCNNAEIERICRPNVDMPAPQQPDPRRMPPSSLCSATLPIDYNGNRINNWTLNELLRAYFVKKTLEYKCEHNGCDNGAVFVTSWFKQIPRILVFHIKRFIPNYYTNTYDKSHDQVKIEKEIDIKMFCNRTLSLPPDTFEQLQAHKTNVNDSKDRQGHIVNDGNAIYSKIFANICIDSLEICKSASDLAADMQPALNKADYKDIIDEKDDDDDIVILNGNIPPLIKNINNININMAVDDDEFMSELQAELQAKEWTAMDECWQAIWAKSKCEEILGENGSIAEIKEYAKMYLRYWKSIELHKQKEKEKKRKRDSDDSDFKQPQSKKQKTEEKNNNNINNKKQITITECFDKQKANHNENNENKNNNNNSFGDDNDADLQRALAASLELESMECLPDNNNDANKNDNNIENSGNINEFRSVCEEECLPNNIDYTQYNLRSIVRHLGLNYQSGHYITDVLTMKEDKANWIRNDDQYVSNISDQIATDNKAQKNAYIFFYVHQSAFQKE